MSDPYFEAIQEQWPNIRALYITCAIKKPIMLYDIQEKKIYAYPYKEFKAELSEKSQTILTRDYKSASARGSMVVFVRDNLEISILCHEHCRCPRKGRMTAPGQIRTTSLACRTARVIRIQTSSSDMSPHVCGATLGFHHGVRSNHETAVVLGYRDFMF
jgi:hypothetical protein